jgi:hypothetical protein
MRMIISLFTLLFLVSCSVDENSGKSLVEDTKLVFTFPAKWTDTRVPNSTNTILPTFDRNIDVYDLESSLFWISYAIVNKQPELIKEIIGEDGVDINSKYMTEHLLPGYNNSDEVILLIKRSLENSTPECAGYESSIGVKEQKASLYFTGLHFNGLKNPVAIGLRKINKWEILIITLVYEESWANIESALTSCPSSN